MRCIVLAAILVLSLTASGGAAHAAGAAYISDGKYPIVFLADQTRDDIQEQIKDQCFDCEDAVASVQKVRDTCLTAVMAKHKAGIGGENELVACMERKSGVYIRQARLKAQQEEARDNDDVQVDYGPPPPVPSSDEAVSDTDYGEPDDAGEGGDGVIIVRGPTVGR
jgi:hypothetical protein